MEIILAIDCQVSKINVQLLEHEYGYPIAYYARDEHDQLWCNRAIKNNATVFISPDYDIEIFCNIHDKKFIRYPQNIKGVDALNYIVKKLNLLK
jgi:predicted nucleic acid-binding protein